jgi:hypothetical protein
MRIMKESGEVLDVKAGSRESNPTAFVTFLHKEDGMAALKKWNAIGKMRCPMDEDEIEEDEIYRIRCKKSHQQIYRELLQTYLDNNLQEKIALWDETPFEYRCRVQADATLADIIPWYLENKEFNPDSFDRAEFCPAFKYSVKNNPRKADGNEQGNQNQVCH